MSLWLLMAGLGCSLWSPDPPDVFIVSVDTLRVDHVGAFNPRSPANTPNIDALAADGVAFTDAHSPVTVTGPAFCSVMTGLPPDAHGVLTNLFRGGTPLSPEHETLAERFASAGYATGAFVSAFTLRKALGLNRGFDVYNGGENKNRNGDATAAAMIPWVSVREGPVFGWFHSFDPHGPLGRMLKDGELDAPLETDPLHLERIPTYQRIRDVTDHELYERLYARGVERADRAVGMVIDGLKAAKRYENALIVFVADHGEGFRERGLWYDHGTSAYVEQSHVPLIVKWPSNASKGSVDGRLVSLLDVAPTVLDAASLEPFSASDGQSLRAEDFGRTVAVSESSHCKAVDALDCAPVGGRGKEVAVRSSTHTAVTVSESTGENQRLYDRRTDAIEFRPIDGEMDEELRRVLHRVRDDRRGRDYDALPGAQSVDSETKALRALGYVE
jgi:arylsulfatase A-like enzyme